jgi:ribonuclease P protein component
MYVLHNALSTHQVLFAVSGKKIKSAVTRNKLKRSMREAYRLNKHHLGGGVGTYFLIGYIYIGSSKPSDFKTLQANVVASLHYLSKLNTKNDHDALPT